MPSAAFSQHMWLRCNVVLPAWNAPGEGITPRDRRNSNRRDAVSCPGWDWHVNEPRASKSWGRWSPTGQIMHSVDEAFLANRIHCGHSHSYGDDSGRGRLGADLPEDVERGAHGGRLVAKSLR